MTDKTILTKEEIREAANIFANAIECAAKSVGRLWRFQIEERLGGDMGDLNGNMFLLASRILMPKPKKEIMDNFETALVDKICSELKEEYWNKDNPDFGSRCPPRILEVDYHPCRILESVCDNIGLDYTYLPIKSFTIMYPDKIKFRFGYSSKGHCEEKIKTP
jgi:hypothetical protein